MANANLDLKNLLSKFKLLPETGLKDLCEKLQLDPVGSSKVLQLRIQSYLKDHPELQPTQNQKSKKRSKKRKRNQTETANGEDDEMDLDVEVEIEEEKVQFKNEFKEFEDVFSKFNTKAMQGTEDDQNAAEEEQYDEEEYINKEEVIQSRKKQRKLNRMTVAQLKQIVAKPEVVEWVDVTSHDPMLLITLKSTRNTVPVPDHWSSKKKFLQGKRGVEKPPYELPEYIKATGIMQLRQTSQGPHSLHGKLRERHHPKLGRLDIDYQKLHDAFFRYQTKPAFSSHGDIYFEGKEFESRLRMRKPGVLTEELKEALNIPKGAPPPWLINMQRYGPPPSYPQLKIPGLNAPIPPGAQWGFHPGGWGKPPTDDYNRPLYGDVFGLNVVEVPNEFITPIESNHWGELAEEEEEEAEESEEDEMEEDEEETSGLETPSGFASSVPSGIETPSGFSSSVLSGIETPDIVPPRKSQPSPASDQPLFTILSQKETPISGFMAPSHTYDMSNVNSRKDKLGLVTKAVDVAINPEELETLDQDTLKRKFEASVEQQTKVHHEDLSDLVAEHAQQQEIKRAKKDTSRQKNFKF